MKVVLQLFWNPAVGSYLPLERGRGLPWGIWPWSLPAPSLTAGPGPQPPAPLDVPGATLQALVPAPPIPAPPCTLSCGPGTLPGALAPFSAQLNFPLRSYHFLTCCTMSLSSHTPNSFSLFPSRRWTSQGQDSFLFTGCILCIEQHSTQNRCTINILKYMLMMQKQTEKQSKDKQVTPRENWGQILDFCL